MEKKRKIRFNYNIVSCKRSRMRQLLNVTLVKITNNTIIV
jgi:hypothetical protein